MLIGFVNLAQGAKANRDVEVHSPGQVLDEYSAFGGTRGGQSDTQVGQSIE
jgi:hypothetical protein